MTRRFRDCVPPATRVVETGVVASGDVILISFRFARSKAGARARSRVRSRASHDAGAAESAIGEFAARCANARREARGRWTSAGARASGARARRRSNVARARGADVRAVRALGERARVSKG